MAARVDRTERLLNLVICLMASSAAVSRADIQSRIPGYQDAATQAAFERMFERDKDELRSMGLPVETVVDAHGEVTGYRIPRDQYALAPIELDPHEKSAVAVAAHVWAQASAGPVAGTAVRKLEATGAGPGAWDPADLAGPVHITGREAALLPLMAAIRTGHTITFDYRGPAEDGPTRREVSPWGLRSDSGRWFLIAWDHDRRAQRTFRVSRIAGPVSITAREREQAPPDEFDVSALDLRADATDVTARIQLQRGTGAELRRLAIETDALHADIITITSRGISELVPLICACGPTAVVQSPPELVREVVTALQRVKDGHS